MHDHKPYKTSLQQVLFLCSSYESLFPKVIEYYVPILELKNLTKSSITGSVTGKQIDCLNDLVFVVMSGSIVWCVFQ